MRSKFSEDQINQINAGSSFNYYVEKEDTILSFDFKTDDTVKAVDLLRN